MFVFSVYDDLKAIEKKEIISCLRWIIEVAGRYGNPTRRLGLSVARLRGKFELPWLELGRTEPHLGVLGRARVDPYGSRA